MSGDPSKLRVLCIGLGRASALAVAALRRRADVEIVAAVDPAPGAAHALLPDGVPVHAHLEALPEADVAIVSTPTPTHVEVCGELFECAPGVSLVLCEKPAALSAAELQALTTSAHSHGIELRVLLHYAYGSEVVWLADHIAGLSAVTGFSAVFEDPYGDALQERRKALGSSWIDSGINALTVLSRMLELEAVATSRADEYDSCSTELSFVGGTGWITTSWRATEPRKHTSLTLDDGAVIDIDHIARTVRAGPRTLYAAPTDNPALRRYETMVDVELDGLRVVDHETTLELHRLLGEGLDAQRTT